MSGPEATKKLQLTLRTSGGILGRVSEIRIDDNMAFSRIIPSSQQTPPEPKLTPLTSETRDRISTLAQELNRDKPDLEYKPTGNVYDGQTYVLQVHEPVQCSMSVMDGGKPPESFWRLLHGIQSAAKPTPKP